jgi:hypothetical protein
MRLFCLYLQAREMEKLRGLAYKQPVMTTAYVPPPPAASTDSVKNWAIVIGSLGMVSGIGWFVLSRVESSQPGAKPVVHDLKTTNRQPSDDSEAMTVENVDDPGLNLISSQQSDGPETKIVDDQLSVAIGGRPEADDPGVKSGTWAKWWGRRGGL